MVEAEFSDEFYRGLSAKDCVTLEGYVTAAAFSFDSYDSTRGDGFCELSINWNDDEGSLSTLLAQHKPFKEEKQFKVGYAKLQRNLLHNVFKQYIEDAVFSYERCPVEADPDSDIAKNPYHGNLLLSKSVNPNIKKNIQHTLATLATQDVTLRSDC